MGGSVIWASFTATIGTVQPCKGVYALLQLLCSLMLAAVCFPCKDSPSVTAVTTGLWTALAVKMAQILHLICANLGVEMRFSPSQDLYYRWILCNFLSWLGVSCTNSVCSEEGKKSLLKWWYIAILSVTSIIKWLHSLIDVGKKKKKKHVVYMYLNKLSPPRLQ